MEDHPAGRMYRRELAHLGLSQPDSLAGIDLEGEVLRMAVVPTPATG